MIMTKGPKEVLVQNNNSNSKLSNDKGFVVIPII